MKLYLVEGTRHSAVVMASSEKESIALAIEVHSGQEDDHVLFGSVGDWEAPTVRELKLPKGWKIIRDQAYRGRKASSLSEHKT